MSGSGCESSDSTKICTDFAAEVAKRLGPLPLTEEEFYGSKEAVRKVDSRRRPGRKIPCYWVHIRYPAKIYNKRVPGKVEKTVDMVVKPKGHTYCRTPQEAYALAYDIAGNIDGDRQVEVRAKMGGQIVLVNIMRGRKGPHAQRGMAKLEEAINAGI